MRATWYFNAWLGEGDGVCAEVGEGADAVALGSAVGGSDVKGAIGEADVLDCVLLSEIV